MAHGALGMPATVVVTMVWITVGLHEQVRHCHVTVKP